MKVYTDDEQASVIVETRSPISSKLDKHIELIETRTSRGYVKDTTSTAKGIPQQPYDYKLFLEMIRYDPVLATALDTTVDVGTRNGYYFMPRHENVTPLRVRRVKERFDQELDFDSVQDNIWYQFVLFHLSFIEYVKGDDGQVNELYPLETSEMFIDYDEHGKINGYVQNSNQGNQVSFSTEDVTMFSWKKIGSQVYPYVNMEPIAKTYVSSIKANDYLQQIFLNMPPKYMYVLKNASQEQRKQFISNLRVCKTNYASDLVATARDGAEAKPLLMPEVFSGLLSVLEYLREQILMVMRIPPVWVGIINSDSANRGNAEAQIFSFETRIKKLQQRIESQINKEVMPRLGYSDLLFKYNNISLQDETKHITNASVLKSIGLDDTSVLYYLREKGICIPADAKIEQPTFNQAAANQTSPSRQGMDKKNEQMKSEVGQKGTSDKGGQKIEEQKIQVRTPIKRWSYDAIQV